MREAAQIGLLFKIISVTTVEGILSNILLSLEGSNLPSSENSSNNSKKWGFIPNVTKVIGAERTCWLQGCFIWFFEGRIDMCEIRCASVFLEGTLKCVHYHRYWWLDQFLSFFCSILGRLVDSLWKKWLWIRSECWLSSDLMNQNVPWRDPIFLLE